MKRLFVGGLSPTVSEKELKDRLGKFGTVSDVEIIIRKDEEGTPLRTFGYVNIDITDAEYKRCVGILNKSTWKGGTLIIQEAKESFLHKLAEERQQRAETTHSTKPNSQEVLLTSLKASGVENFHMKAAVPGTEIAGHKDWIVSKFGRVLPVLKLKNKRNNYVFKYDPSKHCHNIKRLETEDNLVSVSSLTWEIQGGDDEISRKRRGEFPKHKPKKPKPNQSAFNTRPPLNGIEKPIANQNANTKAASHNGFPTKQKPAPVRVYNSDADSEDEIRMWVAQELYRKAPKTSAEDDGDQVEVVGDDLVIMPSVTRTVEPVGLLVSSREDEEYDSADTDEILTRRKKGEETVSQEDSPSKSSKKRAEVFTECDKDDPEKADETKSKAVKSLKRRGNNPEDILQFLFDDKTEDQSSEKKKKQVSSGSLPPFIGTKDLFGAPVLSKRQKGVTRQEDQPTKPPKKLKRGVENSQESALIDESQSRSSSSSKPEKETASEESESTDAKLLKSKSPKSLKSISKPKQSRTSSRKTEVCGDDDDDDDDDRKAEFSDDEENPRNLLKSDIKTVYKSSNSTEETSSEELGANMEDHSEVFPSKTSARLKPDPKKVKKTPTKLATKKKISRSSSSSSSSQNSETSEDESIDAEYEAMMGNCYRLDLSLADLEQMAKAAELSEDDQEPEEKPRNTLGKGIKPKDKSSISAESASPKKSHPHLEEGSEVQPAKPPKNLKRGVENSQESALMDESQSRSSSSSKPDEQSEPNDAKLLKSKSPKSLKSLSIQKQSRTSSRKSEGSDDDDNDRKAEFSDDEKKPRNILKSDIKTVDKSSNSTEEASSEESDANMENDSEVFPSKTSARLKPDPKKVKKTPTKLATKKKISRSSSSSSSSQDSETSDDESIDAEYEAMMGNCYRLDLSLADLEQMAKAAELSDDDQEPEEEPRNTQGKDIKPTDKSSISAETSPEKSHPNLEEGSEVFTSKASVRLLKSSKPESGSQEKQKFSSSSSSSTDSESSDGEEMSVLRRSDGSTAQKQQQDNQKRLEALERRKKETEEQKKLIQGALSNLDSVKESRKHIVFDSDDEVDEPMDLNEGPRSDGDLQQTSTSDERAKDSGSYKLFDGSDEDEDEFCFHKPQFEGKAGQKLMHLQASFGKDPRFQLDSRFLDEADETPDEDADVQVNEEDELVGEKMKNLDIIQKVLSSSGLMMEGRKEPVKGKMFKDVSVLHYDPSREEHSAFESKTQKPEKESKAARKKKREEAAKLPEVSTEIYFNVSADLKEVFGTTKEEDKEQEKSVPWDEEEEEDVPVEAPCSSNAEISDDPGFKFSFFTEETATASKKDEYKVEILTNPGPEKLRFQDSSSEEEDDADEEQITSIIPQEEPTTPKKSFFFFFGDDDRLKEGPRSFCRSGRLGDQREAWEERRTALREECRKRHRDAKRSTRSSLNV